MAPDARFGGARVHFVISQDGAHATEAIARDGLDDAVLLNAPDADVHAGADIVSGRRQLAGGADEVIVRWTAREPSRTPPP